MKPSIVVTGGSGLLALNWALAARDRFAVTLGLHNRVIEVVGVEARQIELDARIASFDAVLVFRAR